MGRAAKRDATRRKASAAVKRQAIELPEAEWWCIWCDGRPPERTFTTREHVIAESLGGPRDFRLKRGMVCDACNKGVLQGIDEEMNLLGPLRWLRADLGIGPPFREVRHGIKMDDASQTSIDTTKLGPLDRVALQVHRDATADLTIETAGPSGKGLAEHLTRGLHRMAYNAVAHFRGSDTVRPRLRFLRDLVLDLERIAPRAHLADWQTEGVWLPC